MADPNEIAEKIARKADDFIAPLRMEMAMAKWPAEFRAIMWQAVADTAAALANEASLEHKRG